jgi:hypothetical protein
MLALCGDSEVRHHVAARVSSGLPNHHTINMGLLLSLRSRSSLESLLQMVTSFAIGTLGSIGRPECRQIGPVLIEAHGFGGTGIGAADDKSCNDFLDLFLPRRIRSGIDQRHDGSGGLL